MTARLKDLKRALKAFDIDVEKPKKGTSHWKAVNSAGVTYPIPAHNGLKTEIGNEYLRGLCRCFGLDQKALEREL